MSASAFYQRATGQRSTRAVGDEKLLAEIEQVAERNYGAYGYRKTWLALGRAGVEGVGRDRVKRLMRAAGIQGAKRRDKPWRTTIADRRALRPPDLVDRDQTGRAVGRRLRLPRAAGEGLVFVRSSSTSSASAWSDGSSRARCAPTRRTRDGPDPTRSRCRPQARPSQRRRVSYSSFAFQQELDDHGVLAPARWSAVDSGPLSPARTERVAGPNLGPHAPGYPAPSSWKGPWRGAGVVERGGLENRCSGNPATEGSNPSPSAQRMVILGGPPHRAQGQSALRRVDRRLAP